jgi:S-adenosylmethionine:tRNA ribosyltransferase-isomerase
MSLRRSDFRFELPPELIAQQPLPSRSASRMLCLEPAGGVRDARIADLPQELSPGDLVVFNDTRVLAARLAARKDTGGQAEILVERLLGERAALAQVRASKPARPGTRLHVAGADAELRVAGREGEFYRLELSGGSFAALLEAAGHMPLPPYIDRADAPADRERYQTVYARAPGAVAAPTCSVTKPSSTPRARIAASSASSKCSPAVGAATAPGARA